MSAIVVERVGPMVTLQDRGRRGLARHGIPASGALDPLAWSLAVAAVGGDDDAAIEIPLSSARFRAEGDLVISIDGEPPRAVEDGAPIEVPANARAVRYLAVRFGLDVPIVLSSRSTLVVAGLGGLEGRPLRRGDRIPIGREARAPRVGRSVPGPPSEPLVAIPIADAGPDAITDAITAAARDAFYAAPFRVDPRSDRVGVRLYGPNVRCGAARLSRPIAPGAVQVPPDGNPIVIGPDGPTTGGYPVIAVLDAASRAALARLRPGAEVRFRPPKTER